jgi:hypothetical protein
VKVQDETPHRDKTEKERLTLGEKIQEEKGKISCKMMIAVEWAEPQVEF